MNDQLTTCSICEEKVATSALSCPHCGGKGPRAIAEEKAISEWLWDFGKWFFYITIGLNIATMLGFEEARKYNIGRDILESFLNELF